ncbi:MAG TPA: hypothetical protein VFM82_09480 [Flavobacteriaceae bacterium]|nr:hypothetical protein [Flavobacteriaceae bacterium]
MKKTPFILPILLLVLSVISCGKDDDGSDNPPTAYECETCPDQPAAKAAFDTNSGGIYKGIVIGSSGTIVLNINNDNSEVTAILTIDGDVINLTSTVAWTEGESYLAPFTGTYNGTDITVTFSVDATGENPVIVTSDIPGHPNAVFTIVKELSTMLVEGFEGTYSTTEPTSGTFNILLSRDINQWGGNARENGTNETTEISGSISNNVLIEDEGGQEVATLNGDVIDGESTDGDGYTLTVHGERTL